MPCPASMQRPSVVQRNTGVFPVAQRIASSFLKITPQNRHGVRQKKKAEPIRAGLTHSNKAPKSEGKKKNLFRETFYSSCNFRDKLLCFIWRRENALFVTVCDPQARWKEKRIFNIIHAPQLSAKVTEGRTSLGDLRCIVRVHRDAHITHFYPLELPGLPQNRSAVFKVMHSGYDRSRLGAGCGNPGKRPMRSIYLRTFFQVESIFKELGNE